MAEGADSLRRNWLASLAHEKRASPHTLRAYGDDVARFLGFQAGHTGGAMTQKALAKNGTMVNVTLCFSPVQAWMAAKAGASFISPFIGRVDDAGEDGMGLIRDIRAVYDNYGFKTEVLAASIRSVSHVRECILAGADVGTMPTDIFKKLMDHPLTDKGLAAFVADAKKANLSIK